MPEKPEAEQNSPKARLRDRRQRKVKAKKRSEKAQEGMMENQDWD